jgi:hypothetical protein
MKSTIMAVAFGLMTMTSMAQAETGIWHRFKEYDIGNAGYVAPMNCMDMPCCAKMKAEGMKDCANMDCCKGMSGNGSCVKMLKSGKAQ